MDRKLRQRERLVYILNELIVQTAVADDGAGAQDLPLPPGVQVGEKDVAGGLLIDSCQLAQPAVG